METGEWVVQRGMPERFRGKASLLYDEAFGPKLSVAVRSGEKRIALLEESMVPAFALAALAGDELAGVAGFQTPEGSFTGGLVSGSAANKNLVSQLGYLKASWAAAIFSLYERKAKPGELLMDGIAVRSDFRGQGIGGRMLDDIAGYAREKRLRAGPAGRDRHQSRGQEAVRAEGLSGGQDRQFSLPTLAAGLWWFDDHEPAGWLTGYELAGQRTGLDSYVE